MNRIIALVMIVSSFSIIACKKPPADKSAEPISDNDPVMRQVNVAGMKITEPNRSLHIDMDNDGTADIHFKTEMVGGNGLYRVNYMITSSLGTALSVYGDDLTKPLALNDAITITDMPGQEWVNPAAAHLMQRLEDDFNNVAWAGVWKDLSNKYAAFMLIRNGKKYAGWVELSLNSKTGTLELFKAAISTEGDKAVKAGV